MWRNVAGIMTQPIERLKHWVIENILIPKAYLLAKPAMFKGEGQHPDTTKAAVNA